MPLASRRNLAGILLMLALVSASIIASSALSSVSTAVPQPAPGALAIRAAPEFGNLFVDVLLGIRPTNYAPLDLPAYFKPIPFEPVLITRTDQPQLRYAAETDFAGLIRLQLPASDKYLLSVNDTRFHALVTFSVLKDQQTNVIIRANRNAYIATFHESQDVFSSGWITPGSRIFLSAPSLQPLPANSGTTYLEVERATGMPRTAFNLTADRSTTQTPLKVTSQELRASRLWLEASPLQPVATAGLTRVFIVAYTSSFTVTYGTELS